MKSASIIGVSVLLFALLSWVALRSVASETASAQEAMRQLDIFAAAESSLHRDMLRARAGLLRNYDPLVRQIDRLYLTLADLRDTMRGDAELRLEIDRLGDMARQQERWTEQFKSQNALMQNSLTYFHMFNVRLRETSRNTKLVLRASAVATALLRLLSDSSQGALDEFDGRLNDFASDLKSGQLSPRDGDLAQALMAHARLLRTALPETDRIMTSMLTIPSKVQQDKLRTMVDVREAASEEWAAFYRQVLYGISLVLVGLTLALALRLQSWARTLKRIARIEHVIADISTRFIKAQSDDLAGEFQHALKELANCIDADRAYFVWAREAEHCHTWSRFDTAWPPNWTDDALRFAAAQGAVADGIIYRPAVHPSQPERVPGMPPDVHGWLCVSRMCGDKVAGILAFDQTRGGFRARRAECQLFRTACDALGNAVLRETLMKQHQRIEETLQQVRRLDTVGAFASGIAHNFNNIVGAILGYAEMAQLQLEAGKAPAPHLVEIKRAGERARDLVEQILKFGRQMVSDQQAISLTSLLSETSSLLFASLPHRITLTIEQDQGDIVVHGQPEQLQQVILNVCHNAAQAIDGPGSISIALRQKSVSAPPLLDHGTVLPGKYVVISVADTGRGMDDATREQMFDPFFTTRADGNGLGLATVREIVLGHGGGVSVYSTPKAGTRLEIWLPCVGRHPVSPGVPARKNTQASGETILLFEVDGERLLRHEEIVAALGFEPVGFVDPAAAIAALRVKPGCFDAAVICHVHGATATLDVVRALSDLSPFTPIVLATASAGDLGARTLAALGICKVVRYPLRTGELSAALARCMSDATRSTSVTIGRAGSDSVTLEMHRRAPDMLS